MELYILRHGIAVPRGTPGYAHDSDRELTPDGIKAMGRIAKGMRAMKLSFDRAFSSPFLRTKQTAEIAMEILQPDLRIEYTDHLRPGGDREVFIGELITRCKASDRVLVVGHEPYLSECISFLCCGDDSLEMNFKKGGLCKLSVPSLRIGKCATLEWLLTPKQLKEMR
jgi:phosphohistidine phosphatase